MNHIKDNIESVAKNIIEKEIDIETGFPALDDILRGFRRQELTIVAGRPSIGKSAIMLNMALHTALKKETLIFSLEMTREKLIERMFATLMEKSLYDLKSGKERVDYAVKENLSRRLLYLDDTSGITTKYIWEATSDIEFDVMFVDYLQMFRKSNRRDARYEEIGRVCQQLREIAKLKNAAVVLLCQLSRAVEQREKHEPRLSDLRESGDIEQVADNIIMLHRPAYYHLYEEIDKDSKDDGEAYLIVNKNRNGRLGRIPIIWLAEWMKFCPTKFELSEEF